MNKFENFYTEFIKANPKLIHMTGHSHHYWPDSTREAIEEAYTDSMKLTDRKWTKIFNEILPKTQELISKILNFDYPEQIAFAPNTHELLVRMLSTLENSKQKTILTTKHEFHSASRQFKRLNEEDDYEIHFVEVDEIIPSLEKNRYDFIYLSHVFYDTGLKLPDSIIERVIDKKQNAIFMLDGYHSFCAIEVNLKKWQDDIFYISGSYKYAQAGEGLCFMTIPKECQLRPQNTGWFASFEDLESNNDMITYANSGLRFSGATRDFTPHYRFNKIWSEFLSRGYDIKTMDEYVKSLQSHFINGLKLKNHLISSDLQKVGHFLSLKTQSNEYSRELYEYLIDKFVLTDYRGTSLRFGFGLYLSLENIDHLLRILNNDHFIQVFNKKD